LARYTPGFLGRQIAREFIRIHARGYSDGLTEAGATEGPGQLGTDRLVSEAKAAGYAFTERVMAPVRRSIQDAFAINGIRVKAQPQLEAEIRTAYARFIEPAPDGLQPAEMRFASPLGLEYKTWEAKNSPISAYLDVLFKTFASDESGLPQLTTSTLSRVVSTERNRLLNAGVYETALLDEEVEYLQFSALKDGRTCWRCLSLDGTVRPKNDYKFWGSYTPPIHDSCRCSAVPVKGQEQKPTEKQVVDKLLESIGQGMQPGFGGHDPRYEIGATR
jgi:SPP1 gp7 family putative phage head morphogenesis protein